MKCLLRNRIYGNKLRSFNQHNGASHHQPRETMYRKTCKPSPSNSRDQFIALVDAAILEGKAIEIDLMKAPASHFVYLRNLYSEGKIDRCSDEWMGVITFASPEIAQYI